MQYQIFYPVLAMFSLTILVAITLMCIVWTMLLKKKVHFKYYRVYSHEFEAPELLVRTRRHFNNLFEMPLLFYTLCAFIAIFKLEDPLLLQFAWSYVALRVLHSVVHIVYNNPLHRFIPFALSCLSLIAMALRIVSLV